MSETVRVDLMLISVSQSAGTGLVQLSTGYKMPRRDSLDGVVPLSLDQDTGELLLRWWDP